MCDCYSHKCGKCRRSIEMHLGDYLTGRDEIKVYHGHCFHKLKMKVKDYTVWEYTVKKPRPRQVYIVVVPKTENARMFAWSNHPNEVDVELHYSTFL